MAERRRRRNWRDAPTNKRGGARAAQEAFTIVEVMMASVVMLFAIATSLIALQMGMRSVDTARHTTIASQVLQSSIELLRLQNWTQIVALQAAQTTPATPSAVDLATTLLPAGGSGLNTTLMTVASRFSCTQLISDLPSRTNIKLITVAVSWKGMDGRSHHLSMQTRYGRDGLSDYLYAY